LNNDFEFGKITVENCIEGFKSHCKMSNNPEELKFIFVSNNKQDQDKFARCVESHNLKYTWFEDTTQFIHGVENILIMNMSTYRKLVNGNFSIVNRSVVLFAYEELNNE
jgi:hypothetical protein